MDPNIQVTWKDSNTLSVKTDYTKGVVNHHTCRLTPPHVWWNDAQLWRAAWLEAEELRDKHFVTREILDYE